MIKEKNHDDARRRRSIVKSKIFGSDRHSSPGDETHSRRYLNGGKAGLPSPSLSADPRQMTRALKDRAESRRVATADGYSSIGMSFR